MRWILPKKSTSPRSRGPRARRVEYSARPCVSGVRPFAGRIKGRSATIRFWRSVLGAGSRCLRPDSRVSVEAIIDPCVEDEYVKRAHTRRMGTTTRQHDRERRDPLPPRRRLRDLLPPYAPRADRAARDGDGPAGAGPRLPPRTRAPVPRGVRGHPRRVPAAPGARSAARAHHHRGRLLRRPPRDRADRRGVPHRAALARRRRALLPVGRPDRRAGHRFGDAPPRPVHRPGGRDEVRPALRRRGRLERSTACPCCPVPPRNCPRSSSRSAPSRCCGPRPRRSPTRSTRRAARSICRSGRDRCTSSRSSTDAPRGGRRDARGGPVHPPYDRRRLGHRGRLTPPSDRAP